MVQLLSIRCFRGDCRASLEVEECPATFLCCEVISKMTTHLRVCLLGVVLLTQLVVSFDVSRLSTKRAPSTQKYSYQFSNVAVTGGGYVSLYH